MNQEMRRAREPARGIAYGMGVALPVWLFVALLSWWLVVHAWSRRHTSRLQASMRFLDGARHRLPARVAGQHVRMPV